MQKGRFWLIPCQGIASREGLLDLGGSAQHSGKQHFLCCSERKMKSKTKYFFKAEFLPNRKSLSSGKDSGMSGRPVSLDCYAVSLADSALLRKPFFCSIFTGFFPPKRNDLPAGSRSIVRSCDFAQAQHSQQCRGPARAFPPGPTRKEDGIGMWDCSA